LDAARHFKSNANVPQNESADASDEWGISIKFAYNYMQQGKTTNRNISQDWLELLELEEIGLKKWKGIQYKKAFGRRCS